MQTTRAFGRTTALALALSTFAAPNLAKAAGCDGTYTISAGDTLGAIAAKCDTTVAAIEEANGVHPRSLQLGQVLAIPKDDEESVAVRESARVMASADTAEDAAGYRVGPGDTLAGIAAELGVPLDALLAANEGVNPHTLQIGDRLEVPGGDEVKAMLAEREAERERIARMAEEYPNPQLNLRKGDWRLTIDIEADGLAPGEPVAVAIRGSDSDWIELGEMPADEDGKLVARARIPGELAGEDSLEIAVERPAGTRVSASYGDGSVMTASRSRPEQDKSVKLAGKVVRGGGCSLLITRDGRTYALTGDTLGVSAGAQILVSGAVEGSADGCVGHDALRVSAVSPLTKS